MTLNQFQILCDRSRETHGCRSQTKTFQGLLGAVPEALAGFQDDTMPLSHHDDVDLAGKNPRSPRWAYKARTDRLMNELRIAAQEDKRVHEVALEDITELVRAARTERVTWEAIGAALGVSARTASRRHGHQ